MILLKKISANTRTISLFLLSITIFMVGNINNNINTINKNFTNIQLLNWKITDSSIDDLDSKIKNITDPRINWLAGKIAFEKYNAKDYAIEIWKKNPDLIEKFLYSYGRRELNNGNFQKAFEYSEIILMIKPESQQAILLLVDPFLETRNWEELTEILDQIIFSSPNNSLAHAVRGWSELQKNEGSRELAISEMEQASKLEQEESETIRYILKSKIILNFTDDDLLLTAHMGFKLLQNDFEFNSVIAKIMLDKNNLDEAITYLDTIQKYSPNHPNTYALFADYYRKIGDYKKSMDYYSKALNLQPEWNVAWFYEGYSDTLFKLDFISQAIENFCKAKKIESEKIKNFNNFDFSCE